MAGSSAQATLDVRRTGLTALHDPGNAAAVDIVFVHGLQGHPRKTWARKVPAGPSAVTLSGAEGSPKQKRRLFSWRRESGSKEALKLEEMFWLADLLPLDCPDARILTWGYDSKVSNFFGGAANKGNIAVYSKDLLYALARERSDCLGRPLVFVAHSLGGIIAKDVIWRASIDPAQDLSDIYASTTGIIFLGTPHRGSDWSQTGKTLERIVAAVCFDTNSQNVKAISPDSFELSLCQENFLRLYNRSSRHFEVRTFQEARGMTGVGYMGLNGKVVDDNSSSLVGSSEERSQPIEDNHMNMCRFPSRGDDGYRKVVGELKKLLSAKVKLTSPQSLQPTESASSESNSAEVSRGIQPPTLAPVATEFEVRGLPFCREENVAPAPEVRRQIPSQKTGPLLTSEVESATENFVEERRTSTGGVLTESRDHLVRSMPSYEGLRSVRPAAIQYETEASEFVLNNLNDFYSADESRAKNLERLAEEATTRGKRVTEEFGLGPKFTPRLIKLAFYDFIIFCDDSSSMNQENRIPAMRETLQRVAEFATKLEPSGISIRFINFDRDGDFDNLTEVDDVVAKSYIDYSGNTRIGQMLQFKVVGPLLGKAKSNSLKKPVIVAIITDGEPTGEPPGSLRDTIRRCKMSPALRRLGEAAVVFLICRVGGSAEAEIYLQQLEEDQTLKGMVYCSPERLDEQLAVFQRCQDDERYRTWLIELFFTALDSVTR